MINFFPPGIKLKNVELKKILAYHLEVKKCYLVFLNISCFVILKLALINLSINTSQFLLQCYE